MNQKEQFELMIRLEESIKYIGEDVKEIKNDIKDIYKRVDSFENILSEHKKYMEEHPSICSEIAELKKRLDKKDTLFNLYIKAMSVINVVVILYLTWLGTIRL